MADSNRPPSSRDLFARRCGEVAFASILTGLAAVVPASVRIAKHAEGSALGFWIPLAGITAAAAAASVFLIRAATGGVRKVWPDRGDRAAGLLALGLWLVASTVVLGAFGSVLSSVTHHRGLGGTTYAWLGLGVAAVLGLISWRLARLFGSLGRRPAVAWGTFIAAGLASGGMIFTAVGRITDGNPGPIQAVVDGFLFAGLCIATARIRLPNANKRIWVPADVLSLVLLIGVGVAMLNRVANAGPAARESVLIASPVLELIAKPDTQPKRRTPKKPPVPSAPASAQPETPPVNEPAPTSEASAPVPAAPRRIDNPDIVVVTLDTVRPDHLGVYGYERKTSPNLDGFAANATVFEHSYAAGPETRTAIAPLVTCKHLVESVRDDRGWPTILRANETVAEHLRAKGYATGAVSSFQWISKARGFDQGFDIFDEKTRKRVHPEKGITGAHAVAQAMLVYDELVKADKPVFLWVHLFDAHASYQSHREFDFGTRDVDKYDAEIAYVDRELARLMAHIGGGERGAKTVWIVLGTHGEAFGEHGFNGHPPKMFEEVVRVPLMVKLPWATPRRVTDAVVSVLDVPATVLSLALGDTADCTGKSLVGLAEGTATEVEGRPMLLVAYDGLHGQPPAYGWLDQRVKYVLYAWREGEKTRLFDLRADPGEKSELQSERPGQAIKLRKQLDARLQSLRKVKESPEN